MQAAALFAAVLNVLAGQAAHTSLEVALPTVDAYWPARHWFWVHGTHELTVGALMVVELYVGVPSGAAPHAGAVLVAVVAHVGQAVHTRSVMSVGAAVTYVPKAHVLTTVQIAPVAAAFASEKLTPNVQDEQMRSFVADPCRLAYWPATHTFHAAQEVEFGAVLKV